MLDKKTELVLDYQGRGYYAIFHILSRDNRILGRSRVGNTPQEALSRFKEDGGDIGLVTIPFDMELLLITEKKMS